MIARDPLDANGELLAAAGPLVAEDGEKSMEDECANEESEDEDLPEEGLLEPVMFQKRAHALIEDYHDVF